MPLVKNVSPKGDLELVLHQQDDEDGTVLSAARVLFVAHGETVEVSQREAKILDPTNWLHIKAAKKTDEEEASA